MDPKTLSVVELRKELSARSLDTSGLKNVLALRLQAALDEEEFGDAGADAVAASDAASATAAAAAGAAAKAKALSVPEEETPVASEISLPPDSTAPALPSGDRPTRPEEDDNNDDDDEDAASADDDDEEGGARARRGKRSAARRSSKEPASESPAVLPSDGAADLGDGAGTAVAKASNDDVDAEESAAGRAKRLKRAERFGLDPATADSPAEKAARAEAAAIAAREAHVAAGGCAGCQFKKHSAPLPQHFSAQDEP